MFIEGFCLVFFKLSELDRDLIFGYVRKFYLLSKYFLLLIDF